MADVKGGQTFEYVVDSSQSYEIPSCSFRIALSGSKALWSVITTLDPAGEFALRSLRALNLRQDLRA